MRAAAHYAALRDESTVAEIDALEALATATPAQLLGIVGAAQFDRHLDNSTQRWTVDIREDA